MAASPLAIHKEIPRLKKSGILSCGRRPLFLKPPRNYTPSKFRISVPWPPPPLCLAPQKNTPSAFRISVSWPAPYVLQTPKKSHAFEIPEFCLVAASPPFLQTTKKPHAFRIPEFCLVAASPCSQTTKKSLRLPNSGTLSRDRPPVLSNHQEIPRLPNPGILPRGCLPPCSLQTTKKSHDLKI